MRDLEPGVLPDLQGVQLMQQPQLRRQVGDVVALQVELEQHGQRADFNGDLDTITITIIAIIIITITVTITITITMTVTITITITITIILHLRHTQLRRIEQPTHARVMKRLQMKVSWGWV